MPANVSKDWFQEPTQRLVPIALSNYLRLVYKIVEGLEKGSNDEVPDNIAKLDAQLTQKGS